MEVTSQAEPKIPSRLGPITNIYLLEWLSPSGKGDWFRRIVSSINTLAWATLFGTVPVIWTNRSKEPGRTEKRKKSEK